MDEELKKEYLEYQYLQQQAQTLQNQVNQVRGAIEETNASIQALESLAEENIFSVGSGVLVKAKPSNNKVLMDVGGKIVVEKTIPEATTALKDKNQKLENALKEMGKSFEEVIKTMQEKENYLRKATEKE
ncbi:MAG: prefoldin subunit alpha [Candidatus Micrarchaeota archaeon]